MRRILHIIDTLGYSGAASQLLVLAKGLVQAGIDVHVCALNANAPRQEEFAAAGVSTNAIARRWALDPLADWQLVRDVREPDPMLYTLGTLCLACSVRSWPAAHMSPATTASTDGNLLRERALERRFIKHAARRVTNSALVRAWCARRGMPTESALIPSGVELGRHSDISRAETLNALNLPADARLIGVIGQLAPQKRVKDLIWAADLLRVLHNNLRLLIIGDGPLRSQLEEYARLVSDPDHIRFVGSGNDVWRITPHLDVLWNASENVGQSVAILEAMAAGVPVVASDTEANRELVADGKTGFLIPLGTRAGRAARARLTDRIFTDPELALRLGKSSIDRATRCFSAEQMLQQHLTLYERCETGR